MWCSFPFGLSAGGAAAVEKELKCVSSCVWVEYCCLLHYHRLLPLPPHLQIQPEGEEEEEEEGVEERKAKGGRLNEWYCVSGHACSS